LATVTGRIGYAVGGSTLLCLGRHAWAEKGISTSLVRVGVVFSDSHIHVGWAVGNGLEYAFDRYWSG
jgi:opacity protein-like surface antigen